LNDPLCAFDGVGIKMIFSSYYPYNQRAKKAGVSTCSASYSGHGVHCRYRSRIGCTIQTPL